jgi:predicted aspartyl protease
MRFLAVILLWLAAAAGGRAAEPVATAPYRVDYGGWFTVQVTVNGRGPYDFVIDTGSTLTIAFENLAAIENFQPTGGANLRVLGISSTDELPPYNFGEIGLGAAVLPNHVGVVIPDWEAPRRTPHGIIGLDFLRRYAVYFDHASRTMTLYPHGGIPERLTDNLARIKLRPNDFGKASGALFTTRGLINRKPTTFIIDLGSISSLINYKSAEAIFSAVITSNSGVGFTTGSHLKDVFDDRTHARTALINRVQLGRVTWRNHGMWVYNAPIFDELGVQRLAYGLAGVDLLADRDFALDFGENNLFVSKRPD